MTPIEFATLIAEEHERAAVYRTTEKSSEAHALAARCIRAVIEIKELAGAIEDATCEHIVRLCEHALTGETNG